MIPLARSARLFFVLGCISGTTAVALGAFTAHGLRQVLTPDLLGVFETGVRYQMYHVVGFFATSWALHTSGESTMRVKRTAGWCFLLGTVLFSGSLYLLAVTDIRWLGAVTPIGGVAFLAGWVVLAYSVWSDRRR
jgi:uncharacterized membrane protein YgdD (TMEM256/DUF423 family)